MRVAIHPDDRGLYDSAVRASTFCRRSRAGPSAGFVARSALEKLATLEPVAVLMHDGARPFWTSVIDRVLERSTLLPGRLPALPIARHDEAGGEDGNIRAASIGPAYGVRRPRRDFDFASFLAAHRLHRGTGSHR